MYLYLVYPVQQYQTLKLYTRELTLTQILEGLLDESGLVYSEMVSLC